MAEIVAFPITYPLAFTYTLARKKRSAARQFVYCWYKDPDRGWKSVGVLMTDDWGFAHLAETVAGGKYSPSTVRVVTKPLGSADDSEALPFAFYTPQIINEFRFEPDQHHAVGFSPGTELAFMCAPLDTIRASDEALSDPRGFRDPPKFTTEQNVDIYALEESGDLVRVTLEQPERVDLALIENGKSTTKSVYVYRVKLPLTLPAYVALVKAVRAVPRRSRGARFRGQKGQLQARLPSQ